jgi:hypothetical protein
VRQVPLVVDGAGDAGDVVVADERLRHDGREHRVVAAEGVVELEQVPFLDRVADRLPQLVLGDGVHARGRDDVGVLAVDHLTHDEDVGEPLPHLRQYPRPERRWHGASRVQAPAVGARGEPVDHHGDDVLGDGGLVASPSRV